MHQATVQREEEIQETEVAIYSGPLVERLLFAGDVKRWLDGQIGSGIAAWLLFDAVPISCEMPMSVETIFKPEELAKAKPNRRGSRTSKPGVSLMAQGEPLVWLTGGALVLCVTMTVGLLGMVLYWGTFTFWPAPLVSVELADGTIRLGEVTRREGFTISSDVVSNMNPEIAESANKLLDGKNSAVAKRRLFRTGNYELTKEDFN